MNSMLSVFHIIMYDYSTPCFGIQIYLHAYPLLQSPGEKLSAVCVKSTDGDLDKVLFNLDKEEYQVDTKRRDKAGDGKIDTVINSHETTDSCRTIKFIACPAVSFTTLHVSAFL